MKRYWLIVLMLVAAIVAVYWQVQDHDFVLADDPLYIVDNSHARGGLSIDNLFWALTTGHAANWHPVTWLSHMLDADLFARNPGGHHLTSVFLHVMNSILLFFVFSRMTRSVWQSAFVAIVFALHPLHVESVAWAAQRKDVLAGLFCFITILVYTFYVERKRKTDYLLVLFFFSLGLMAKPMLVTLPFLLLILDYWPLRRYMISKENLRSGSQRQEHQQTPHIWFLIKEKIPLLVLSTISSVITFAVQQHGGAVSSWSFLSLDSRISNALVAYIKYLGKTIWPVDLAVFYPHPLTSLPLWQPLVAGVLLIAISALAIRTRRDLPYISVGWFWFVGTLVPVIGLVQVGEQSMADRYMYIPLIGLSILMAWGMSDLLAKFMHRRIILTTAGGIVMVALTGLTYSQVSYWKDTLALFDHAARVTTNNYVALANIGTVYQNKGKLDTAIQYYEQSLTFNKSYELARYNLAVALQARGENEKAIAQYLEALRLQPRNAAAHYGVAMLLSERGQIQESANHYTKALRIEPDYWQAHYGLGLTFSRRGILDSAIIHFEKALQLEPDHPYAHFQLGAAFHRKGQLREAAIHYSQAIKLKPNYGAAHGNLGAVLHQQGSIAEAIEQYQLALRLNPESEDARNNLQAALQSQQQKQKQ